MLCEHKFKTANKYVEDNVDSFYTDVSGWNEYRVLSMPDKDIFIKKFNEVSESRCNFGFRCDVHDDEIYIRGVEKEIDDFMELVNEECLGFNYSVVHRQPELVCDPECPECTHLKLFGSNVSYETYGEVRSKGMTSEVARRKKLDGHIEEGEFANLIGGEVVSGNDQKQDVLSKNKTLKLSLKSEVLKYQVFLYSKKHFSEDVGEFHELAPYFKRCILCFPEDKDKYKSFDDYHPEKYKCKHKLKSVMSELKNVVEDNLEHFFDISFFANGSNAMALQDKGYWYIYEQYEFLECLYKDINVILSKGTKIFPAGGQKIVFQAPIGQHGKKYVTIGEIEMRNDYSIYRNLKFWMGGPVFKYPLFTLLRKYITAQETLLEKKVIAEEEIENGIILCGKAINFKEELSKEA